MRHGVIVIIITIIITHHVFAQHVTYLYCHPSRTSSLLILYRSMLLNMFIVTPEPSYFFVLMPQNFALIYSRFLCDLVLPTCLVHYQVFFFQLLFCLVLLSLPLMGISTSLTNHGKWVFEFHLFTAILFTTLFSKLFHPHIHSTLFSPHLSIHVDVKHPRGRIPARANHRRP